MLIERPAAGTVSSQDAKPAEARDEQRMHGRLGGNHKDAIGFTAANEQRGPDQRVQSAGACARQRESRAGADMQRACEIRGQRAEAWLAS